MLHTIPLPDTAEPTPLLACSKRLMVYPRGHYFGKPVEVWCTDTYAMLQNKFFLSLNIVACAIVASETICNEHVRVAVPIIQ